MYNSTKHFIQIAALCGMFTFSLPMISHAALNQTAGPGLSEGGFIVTVNADTVNINKSHDSEEVIAQASKGAQLEVVEDMGDGWVKVKVGDTEGYLPVSENATITAGDLEEQASGESVTLVGTVNSTSKRENLVAYALQFVGGAYRYGGSSPSGFDCSGFTQYVLRNGAGVNVSRSSKTQAQQGTIINSSQMKPGDLIFYGPSVSGINHVALYIGNGQIVHASTYKTGVKISNWNYRSHVRIVNVLGD